MSVLPRALLWERLDTTGVEQVVLDDRRGLAARGVQIAADPLPFVCRYELFTDDGWVSARFEATAEGAGWLRTVRMERAAGRWRVTTAEQGDLDAALRVAGRPLALPPGSDDPDALDEATDLDLGGSPLTNTLALRRLNLREGSATVTVALVLPPSLAVLAASQTYTALDGNRVRFSSDSFTADLELDPDRYVLHYPGLARRAG
jgi:hypothetical protein